MGERERAKPRRRATAGDDAVIALSATAPRPRNDMHNIAPACYALRQITICTR